MAHIDDEAAYFEDAVLNPALELDPDATIEGFKAAISAEISARIAASKSAVKAEATQLYKANVVGSNLAWRKNNDSYQTNSAYTDAGFTHEPVTEFTVGGSGRSGRGQKQPAFGATEGHYDPSGRASRRVSGRISNRLCRPRTRARAARTRRARRRPRTHGQALRQGQVGAPSRARPSQIGAADSTVGPEPTHR